MLQVEPDDLPERFGHAVRDGQPGRAVPVGGQPAHAAPARGAVEHLELAQHRVENVRALAAASRGEQVLLGQRGQLIDADVQQHPQPAIDRHCVIVRRAEPHPRRGGPQLLQRGAQRILDRQPGHPAHRVDPVDE
jgi:hypothetical protein